MSLTTTVTGRALVAATQADEAVREAKERLLWAVLARLGPQQSFLEIACDDGWLVRAARHAGSKPAIGITSSAEVKRDARRYAVMLVRDYYSPFRLHGRYDMVVCLREATAALLDNVAAHTTRYALVYGVTQWHGFEIVPDHNVYLDEILQRTPLAHLAGRLMVYER